MYCFRRSTMAKKKYTKKKNVIWDSFDGNSAKDGIIATHGSTAGGWHKRWHLYEWAYHSQYVHQAPVTSDVTGHQTFIFTSLRAPGTGHPVIGHWVVNTSQRAPVSECWSAVNQASGTGHWAPVNRQLTYSPDIRQQTLGTEYWVANCRHSLSLEQSVTNEPQSSMNKQRGLLPLEPDFNTLSRPKYCYLTANKNLEV